MSFTSILADLLQGASTTAVITIGSWVVSLVVGLVMALIRTTPRRSVIYPMRFIVTTLRSLPQLVVLYLVYFGLAAEGISVDSLMAAILALGLCDSAFMAEYYRAGFQTISEQQRDAGYSLGLSRFEVFRFVVFPQAIPFLIPPVLNSFVGLLKTSTYASAVGAPEILYRGQAIISRSGNVVQVAVTVLLLYVVVTLPLAHLVSILEHRAQAFRRARVT